MRATVLLTLALTACGDTASNTRDPGSDPAAPQSAAPVETITAKRVGEACELSAPQACRTTQSGGTAYCWTSEQGPVCRQEVPGKLGDVCRSSTATTLYLCPLNSTCNMVTNTCTDGPLVGYWWAPSVPLASITGDVTAEVNYHFEVNGNVAYDVRLNQGTEWVGDVTFSGTYVAQGSGLDVTLTYGSATGKLKTGEAVTVSEGTCPKHNDCPAFVFSGNAAFPEPCMCKVQTRAFTVEGTHMLGKEFGEDVTFYLER